jgi:hypothetical protein
MQNILSAVWMAPWPAARGIERQQHLRQRLRYHSLGAKLPFHAAVGFHWLPLHIIS